MTLKELKQLWGNPKTTVNLTAVAYYAKSKKYYSFRTLDWGRRMDSFDEKTEPYTMSLEIKRVYTHADVLYIDVIEWIEEEEDL